MNSHIVYLNDNFFPFSLSVALARKCMYLSYLFLKNLIDYTASH